MKKDLSKKSRLIVFCIVIILALGVFSPVAMAAVTPKSVYCGPCEIDWSITCSGCYWVDGKCYTKRKIVRVCYDDASGRTYRESCGCTSDYYY